MSTKVKKHPYLFPLRDAADNDKVTLVPVSKDFYINAYREINRKRKHLQCIGECCCPRKMLWKCDGDCERCRYRIPEQPPLHLDAPIAGQDDISFGDTFEDDSLLPDDVITDKELLDALFRELAKLDDRSREMCEIMPTMSEREAAAKMNTPRNTLVYQWKTLKEKLRANLQDYR